MRKSVNILMTIVLGGVALCAACVAYADTTAHIANNGADEVLRIIDTEDSTATLEVGNTPYGVAVTPDGTQVLVTLLDSDALVFINTSDFSQIVSTLPIGSAPRGVAVEAQRQIRLRGQLRQRYDLQDQPFRTQYRGYH